MSKPWVEKLSIRTGLIQLGSPDKSSSWSLQSSGSTPVLEKAPQIPLLSPLPTLSLDFTSEAKSKIQSAYTTEKFTPEFASPIRPHVLNYLGGVKAQVEGVRETQQERKFTLFSLLPPEIRQQIWAETLPTGPGRVLHMTTSDGEMNTHIPLCARPPIKYIITPQSLGHRPRLSKAQASSSYGRVQYQRLNFEMLSNCNAEDNRNEFVPAALAVNRESRAEALRHLTVFNDVWCNLSVDSLYFEASNGMSTGQMINDAWNQGLLENAKHLAIDWREMAKDDNDGRELLATTRLLPQLQTLTFVYTKPFNHRNHSSYSTYNHAFQPDIITPGVPWTFGPTTSTICLDDEIGVQTMRTLMEETVEKLIPENDRVNKSGETFLVRYKEIYGRQKKKVDPVSFTDWSWITTVQHGEDWFG